MKKFLWVIIALLTLTLTACSSKEIYSGEGFEFDYDPNKWELNYTADDGLASFVRKGFDDVSFGVYRYTLEEKFSLAERLERSEELCEKTNYVWDGGEVFSSSGREWCRAEYHHEVRGDTFKFVIFLTDNGTYAYTMDLVSDIDSYDRCLKDFEEIFDSFKITE